MSRSNQPTLNSSSGDPHRHFVHEIIDHDLETGKTAGVVTRFPPEPNGYLHIGHAKAICLNFGIAQQYGGRCHLRFDDTNPTTEDMEYAEGIQRDIRWLGFDWGEHLYYASDYFERIYAFAVHLVKQGLAYVCSLNEEQIREYRGTISEPGRESPYRNRSVEESLDLLERMRKGEFEDGAHVLRAKIDMSAKNMLMRDPLLYRIRRVPHFHTGDAWSIYPMYDFAHCLEDAIECVTHSLCSLEFENNREIYDWVLDHVSPECRPHQYEFARLNLNYTLMSKRKLLQLVNEGHVSGWDDPRMPTLAGLRRRGYTPESIRNFCDRVGVAKTHNVIDVALLEFSLRDDLNQKVPRVLTVLRPLKVVIENYPEDQTEELDAPYYPRDVPKEGSRALPFTRELYIERDDFAEDPPPGFFRLAPGREVRLRYAYFIRCHEVIKDAEGEVIELRCTYDPETRGGNAPDGRKVQGTLHWVSATHSLPVEVRLYDRLFSEEEPGRDGIDFQEHLNPRSLEILDGCRAEPSLGGSTAGDSFQFERQGFFTVDPDSRGDHLVFNRTVTLKDTWAKLAGDRKARERKELAARRAAEKAAAKERQRLEAPSASPEPELGPEQIARFERYRDTLGLAEADATRLAADEDLGQFFEQALEHHDQARSVANWVLNELLREVKDHPLDQLPFGPAELAQLVALVDAGKITGAAGKEVFAALLESGSDPKGIVKEKGLEVLGAGDEMDRILDRVLEENPEQLAAYRGGKTALLGFFVGQVMRATGGRANPQELQAALRKRLAGD